MSHNKYVKPLFRHFKKHCRIERKQEILKYRARRYDNLTNEQLQSQINQFEDDQENSKNLTTVFNLTLLSMTCAAVAYVFKQFSLWLIALHNLQAGWNVPSVELQSGKLIDTVLAGFLLAIFIIFWICYNFRRSDRRKMIRELKSRLR